MLSENLRLGFGKRIEHGFAAGSHKGHFLTVHGMGLAVIDRHTDIGDGVTGHIARGKHVPHAFFHGRNEVKGNDAALNPIHKLKAGAARQGFHLKKHFPELAGAARLLLVAGVAFGGCPDRFTVGNRRRACRHFKLELILHALKHRAYVHFGKSPQHRFV